MLSQYFFIDSNSLLFVLISLWFSRWLTNCFTPDKASSSLNFNPCDTGCHLKLNIVFRLGISIHHDLLAKASFISLEFYISLFKSDHLHFQVKPRIYTFDFCTILQMEPMHIINKSKKFFEKLSYPYFQHIMFIFSFLNTAQHRVDFLKICPCDEIIRLFDILSLTIRHDKDAFLRSLIS